VFEIGASLKDARLRKGVDLAQAESATKIRGKYLQALEDESFEQLPSPTYIKGFLRSYAEYLGLDGQLYVDEFNSRYVAPEEQPIRVRRTARPARHRRVQRNVLVAALVGIAVVTTIVIVAWKSGSPSPQHVPGLSPSTTTPRKPARKPQNPHRAAAAKPTIVLKAVGAPVFLIAVRKNSPTGQILFEGKEIAPGHSIHFRRRKLWVNTGTPEALRVAVDGKPKRLPGGKPSVFVVTSRGVSESG
jgi:cytoskeletal protein RodZ